MDISQLVAARLDALGNETRLAIFRILVRAGRDGLPVGVLQKRTGVPPHKSPSLDLKNQMRIPGGRRNQKLKPSQIRPPT